MRLAWLNLGGLAGVIGLSVVVGCGGGPGGPGEPGGWDGPAEGAGPGGRAEYRLEFDGAVQGYFGAARFLDVANYLSEAETAAGLRIVDLAVYNPPAAPAPGKAEPASAIASASASPLALAPASPLASPSALTPAPASAPASPSTMAAAPAPASPLALAPAPASSSDLAAAPALASPTALAPASASVLALAQPPGQGDRPGADPGPGKRYRRVVLEQGRLLGPLLSWTYEWEGGKAGQPRNAVIVTPAGIRYDLSETWPAAMTGRELPRLRAAAASVPTRELAIDKLELAALKLERTK